MNKISFIVVIISVLNVQSAISTCCHPEMVDSGTVVNGVPVQVYECADKTRPGLFACCSTKPCNMFCCNCDAECRKAPPTQEINISGKNFKYFINPENNIFIEKNSTFHNLENIITDTNSGESLMHLHLLKTILFSKFKEYFVENFKQQPHTESIECSGHPPACPVHSMGPMCKNGLWVC